MVHCTYPKCAHFAIQAQRAMGQDTDHAQSVWMWIQLYASPQEAPATILETVRCVLELAYAVLVANSRQCWLKHNFN